jgi:hypothetical protein
MQTDNTVEFPRKFARFTMAWKWRALSGGSLMRRFVGTSLMAVWAVPFRRGMKRERFDFSTRSMIRPGSGGGFFEEAIANFRLSQR